MSSSKDTPPLIAHVIYSLGVGGLENGVVNLINRIPADRFRHAVICLKNSTDFSQRLQRKDVAIYELNKREGHDWKSFLDMYRLLRQLQPAIVHSRNLAALEYQLPAFLAGVRYRIHGEHGWDVFDPEGNNKKYQLLRKTFGVLIHRFIPLSRQLEDYLVDRVGISAVKISRICNGVDTETFYPATGKAPLSHCPLSFHEDQVHIGTVGRMHGVKDQMTLVKAFVQLLSDHPESERRTRLIMVGEGPIREQAKTYLEEHKLDHLAWLPGERSDVAEIMRNLDIFVLPSRAEGISNTILEAMATGLPVIATNVGGNPELVVEGVSGKLVAKEDFRALAAGLADYVNDPEKRRLQGRNAHRRVLQEFSMAAMVEKYMAVYNRESDGHSN